MKTVITYGVFDLFHRGHSRLLERARALGDRLIVGVTTDDFTRERGKYLLADPFETRVENVIRSGFADLVIPEDHFGQKLEDIQKYHADIFVLGDDWKGKLDYLHDYCEVVYLPRTEGISSSSLRGAPYPKISFGIIGSGRIAGRFLSELAMIHGGVHAVSVFNPNAESARAFASAHPPLTAAGSTEELFQASDAVYIASPHDTHYAYAKAALAAGCHVLCEKPLTLSRREAEELFALAQEKELVLMEAVKTACCPGFVRLVSSVRAGIIGQVRDVESCFTRLTDPGTREWTDHVNGGSFTEFASYTLLPVLKFLGTKGLQVRFESLLDEDGMDLYTKAFFSNGTALASAKNGLGIKSEGELIIAGTKGYIRVPSPWWKTTVFEIHREDPSDVETHRFTFAGDGLRYEISEFIARMQGWHKSDYQLTRAESCAMAGIIEQYLAYRNELREGKAGTRQGGYF